MMIESGRWLRCNGSSRVQSSLPLRPKMKVAALALGVLVLASTRVSALEPFGAEAVPSKSVDLIAVWQVLRRELAEDAAKKAAATRRKRAQSGGSERSAR